MNALLHRLRGHKVNRAGWALGPHPGRIWTDWDCMRTWVLPDWTNRLGRLEWKERG